MITNKDKLKAIELGIGWACSECHWNQNECEIAKIAKEFDPNFKDGIFCEFDIELVIKKMLRIK